ncbi:MAG: hypothetical protein IPJ40_03020 [Saprospirales bacterium]|nr:hypothetical protein [Saprospirales bacterium]
MISNTDWDLSMSRNIRLMRSRQRKNSGYSYDFDFSGLVNAFYACPSAESVWFLCGSAGSW